MENYRISLAAARINANLTQSDVAENLGVSKATIVNWETGKTSPDAPQFMRLCELYKCPPDVIFLLET